MNYQTFAKWIIRITTMALLLCIAAFFTVLLKFHGSNLDFQGASEVASILPAFAGVLIAAIALYSYVKKEDPVHGEAMEIFRGRKKVLSTAELMILMDQRFINEMNARNNEIAFYAHALASVLEDGLGTIIGVVAEIQIYLEQVLPAQDKEAFVEVVGDLKVIRGQIARPDVAPGALISMCYKAHDSVHRLVELIIADMEANVGPDRIYRVLTLKGAADYRKSRGQMVAARHREALRHLSALGGGNAAAAE